MSTRKNINFESFIPVDKFSYLEKSNKKILNFFIKKTKKNIEEKKKNKNEKKLYLFRSYEWYFNGRSRCFNY